MTPAHAAATTFAVLGGAGAGAALARLGAADGWPLALACIAIGVGLGWHAGRAP